MKRLFAMAVGVSLSVLPVAAVNAASVSVSGNPQVQQGETNGKKAMKSMREQEKKRREIKKLATVIRQKELNRNRGVQDQQTMK